jgi:hypothetical protein
VQALVEALVLVKALVLVEALVVAPLALRLVHAQLFLAMYDDHAHAARVIRCKGWQESEEWEASRVRDQWLPHTGSV